MSIPPSLSTTPSARSIVSIGKNRAMSDAPTGQTFHLLCRSPAPGAIFGICTNIATFICHRSRRGRRSYVKIWHHCPGWGLR